MLFVLVMEVINHSVRWLDGEGLLAQLGVAEDVQRVSLYADDLVLFVAPIDQDLRVLKSTLQIFGLTSGLMIARGGCCLILRSERWRTSSERPLYQFWAMVNQRSSGQIIGSRGRAFATWPRVFAAVPKRKWGVTVADALMGRAWVHQVTGPRTMRLLMEFVAFCNMLAQV
jgi:hypothetical protein